ncbi:unnamed protein product [Brassica rapa]|uniref:Uncharacterized protein n=1 Tax=Brassica campestris TaxID=3711 RepID=A0A8D9G0W7_BRACM|nr:unnamed protein product [Brassica rapa]
MCVRQHTQDVSVCLCVSVSTHGTSVAVHQYTYQHAGPWTQHAGPSRGLFGTHISTLVLGFSTLTLPVECLGDFVPCGLSVEYTQDVCGCPLAHTGRLWLSVCVRVCPCVSVSTHRTSGAVRVTHRTSVAIHQYTYQHVGPWTQHAGPSRGLFSTHRTSVGVRQHTQDVLHTGRLWVSTSTHRTSVAVRVCPSVTVSTHRTSVSVHQTSVAVCVCLCVSVGVRQHTQDVRGCQWLSHRTSMCVRQHTQDVRVCLCVSVSTHGTTHMTSVGVRQHTQDVRVTLTHPVDCSGDFVPCGLSLEYTQDVCGCPLAHTGRPWLSVCVRVCPSVAVSTHRTSVAVHPHISTFILGLSTLALPVDCLGHFGPLHTGRPWVSASTQRTFVADVRGCPSAHTGHPWLSVCVRVCPCVSISTHRTLVAVH